MKKRRITLPDGSGQIEVDAEDESVQKDVNAETLRRQVSAALEVNRSFLAIANPTPPQTAAQVKLLTQESSALIRLLIDRLEGTD